MNIHLGRHHPPECPQGAAVTIGNFDGVHLGHKHILQTLKRQADTLNLPVVVVIFEPQPKEFFAKKFSKPQLTQRYNNGPEAKKWEAVEIQRSNFENYSK